MAILVFNAGSSTLKFALFDAAAQSLIAAGVVDWHGGAAHAALQLRLSGGDSHPSTAAVADYGQAVSWILRALADAGIQQRIDIVGYRVVHGGTRFSQPTLIDDRVSQTLAELQDIAPLHNPPAVATISAARQVLAQATHVAVFDTGFFADLPQPSMIYPVPFEWIQQFGIRRFGFHGISHQYCAGRAAELLGRQDDADLRLIVCHLGNGCSATAVRGGRPIATTMGFTPLEGLMMGTRCGSVDPGILLHLLQHQQLSVAQLAESLNRQSGLLGISGVSSDFRQVERAAQAGHARAALAIEMFTDRIRTTIGGLAVGLSGVDALVFTAGIGQHSATLRQRVCQGLQCLNLHLDDYQNQRNYADSDIACTTSAGRILIIETREECEIARAAHALCSAAGSDAARPPAHVDQRPPGN